MEELRIQGPRLCLQGSTPVKLLRTQQLHISAHFLQRPSMKHGNKGVRSIWYTLNNTHQVLCSSSSLVITYPAESYFSFLSSSSTEQRDIKHSNNRISSSLHIYSRDTMLLCPVCTRGPDSVPLISRLAIYLQDLGSLHTVKCRSHP